jgi:hypothetical protein
MQTLSFCSCIAIIVAVLAPQTLCNNASIAHAVTAMLRCCCAAVLVPALAMQASSGCCCRSPAVFVSACGTTAPTKTATAMEVAVTPIPATRREGTTRPHSAGDKKKQKQCHHCRLRCLCCDDFAALHFFCSAGNTRVFALCCCCCHLVVFVSAHVRRNQQPTKPLREEEEDLMSWLTPAFLVLPKTQTRKNWKVYHLFCILSVFSSSHRIQNRSWQLFFIV